MLSAINEGSSVDNNFKFDNVVKFDNYSMKLLSLK